MKASVGGKKEAGGRKSVAGGTTKGFSEKGKNLSKKSFMDMDWTTKGFSEKSKNLSKTTKGFSEKGKNLSKKSFMDMDFATFNPQVNAGSGNGEPPTSLPQMWMSATQGINSKGRSTWWEAVEIIQSGRQPAPLHRLKGKLLIPWLNAQLLRKGIRAEQLRLFREESKGPAVLLSVNKVKVVNNMLNHPHVQVRGPVRLGPVYAVERS